MSPDNIQFGDGDAYEQSMGVWSQIVGSAFLSFLNVAPGRRWLDVGCGNGAFTELILAEGGAQHVDGLDPSEGQLAYARQRLDPGRSRFIVGRAEALPYEDRSFDVVTMALVLFFTPKPDAAVAEMARVVRRKGVVAAYSWDMLNGGFPFESLQAALRDMGFDPPLPPGVEASQMSVMRQLWSAAGLTEIRTSVIEVNRLYANWEDLWSSSCLVASIRPLLKQMTDAQRQDLKSRLQKRCPANPDGSIACHARANAIVGVAP